MVVVRHFTRGNSVRYAPDRKEKTRAKILRAAGRVFRREGYHAAGVDKVMAEAGLTAGAFYAHFESKQALLAEAACTRGQGGRRARPERQRMDCRGRERVAAFVRLSQSRSLPRGRGGVPAGGARVGSGASG